MAVNSNNEISDSDDSASDSNQVKEKSEHSIIDKQFFLVDPNLVWHQIYRRKSDTMDNFRLNFFEFLNKYLINHRDLYYQIIQII
jgi:hypothetical protein